MARSPWRPDSPARFALDDGSSVTLGGRVRAALNATRLNDSWSFDGLSDGVGADLGYVTPGGATFRLSGDMSGIVWGDLLTARATAGVSAPIN